MAKAVRAAQAPKEGDTSSQTSGPASGEQGPDAPSSGAATGTNSSDDGEQSDGGAGDTAGSAGLLLDQVLGGFPADRLDAEAEFRAMFPFLSAAFEAWRLDHEDTPTGLRIKSKVDGFRRAGMAHSREPVEHLAEVFSGPEQIEALLAEPNLTVELF